MQELSYPPSILDLMVICWSRDPNDRPSANEIVLYTSRPEFCGLLSSVAIGDGLQAVCACCVTMATGDVISPRSSALEGRCYYELSMLKYVKRMENVCRPSAEHIVRPSA